MKIAVVGATGLVGGNMLKVLEERGFANQEIIPAASAKSVGKNITFAQRELKVVSVEEAVAMHPDYAIFSAGATASRQYAPMFAEVGTTVIDNSSAWRKDADKPLVVPEINFDAIKATDRIIANPNCSTIITLMAVKGIYKLSRITAMNASTYQAVSGAGAGGPIELEAQNRAIMEGKPVECVTFPYQIAENLIPQIGSFNPDGYTTEEMKMQNEGRKIFHDEGLRVTCTCVRVPVVRSHSISVTVYTENELSVDDVKRAIAKEEGCRLVDDPANKVYPMPLDTSDQDLVFVGRIRKDLLFPNGITLFCCGDQVRKGAATNAVEIAEEYIRQFH